jgi:hypothetical protein
MNTLLKTITIASMCSTLVLPLHALAAKGAGGGGTATPVVASGGGGTKAPLSFPSTGIISAASGVPGVALAVTATSGVNQPTITLTSSSFPEVTVANVAVYPSGKFGPVATTILTLNPWTPTRNEIGTGTIVLTATDGTTTQTYTLKVTVLDAPTPVTGLAVVTDGVQDTATWQAPLVGGTGAISYAVQACYRTIIRAPDGLAAICEDIGTTADTTMTFPAHTSLFTNDPPGTYFEVLVTPNDSVGVRGPATLYLLP